MPDFSLRDLAAAVGFAAVAYTLFNALVSFGSGKPLADWINPHRRHLLPLAAVLLLAGYTLLIRAGYRHGADAGSLLRRMVSRDEAGPEVIGAVSCGMLAAALLALYFWCRWLFPRAPVTFTPGAANLPAEYRRAMRHYVRWSGQLDYVVLWRLEGRKAEKVAAQSLAAPALTTRLRRVESIGVPADAKPNEAAATQVTRWDELATRIFADWGHLDDVVLPARQGGNSLVFFDLQFGGVFVELLPGFRAAEGEVRTFLFAVCVNQAELDTASATRYYTMLSAAVRHIRSGGQKV
jgi:hypothetical protein